MENEFRKRFVRWKIPIRVGSDDTGSHNENATSLQFFGVPIYVPMCVQTVSILFAPSDCVPYLLRYLTDALALLTSQPSTNQTRNPIPPILIHFTCRCVMLDMVKTSSWGSGRSGQS